ncbi:hypothetical protein [Sulfurospirillum arcachonense]|uniref:hypothetical protein n=1 Tax=Sulfurospirillum arcachonense TaxID=57666 RepID=UPI0004689F0D|nr:hypothetical protein [Sulfurospirillum arcachonense]
MKRLLALLITAFMMVGMMSSSAFADAAKGQKYYLKFLKKKTSLKGSEFAVQHTQEEWKTLFADGGAKFIAEYSTKYPKLEKFFNGDKFKNKYMKHISDFCIEYASDSGNVPSC